MAAKEMGEKQIFGITVGVFAAILLVVGTLIYLSFSSLSRINTDSRNFERQEKDARKIADRKTEVTRTRNEIKDRVDDCLQYLPKADEVQRMLENLSAKSTDAGLGSTTIKIDVAPNLARPGATKPVYETIRYKCEFLGSFHQLAKFVSGMENWKTFKRFVNITAFAMEADSKGLVFDDGAQKHLIKMTLELYKYPEPVAAPGMGVPGAVPGAPAPGTAPTAAPTAAR